MAELLSVARVFADGYHNAFTNLLYWEGHYYLMSYYSQHERLPLPLSPPTPADVFLARFRV